MRQNEAKTERKKLNLHFAINQLNQPTTSFFFNHRFLSLSVHDSVLIHLKLTIFIKTQIQFRYYDLLYKSLFLIYFKKRT